MDVDREQFIEILNQEFLNHKGYGVYAYLTSADVLGLYEDYKAKNISLEDFVKTYFDLFATFDTE